jgi:hypothetical protein
MFCQLSQAQVKKLQLLTVGLEELGRQGINDFVKQKSPESHL